MKRRHGRGTIGVRMGVTKKVTLFGDIPLLIGRLQVLGSSHPHLDVNNKIMANTRHYHVRPERVGRVAVLAIDDLEKMPLDQMAYNGKKAQAVSQPMLAPTSNYSNGRKLVITSLLVLTTLTVANEQRTNSKRPKLVRYTKDISSLPLSAMQDFVAAEDGSVKKVEIVETDRSGIPVIAIKALVKNSKSEHEPWSQPASGLQLVEDLLLLYQQLDRDEDKSSKLHQHLLSADDDGEAVPWIIITSDGASDQSVQNLMTIIPLVDLMQMLDLDGIEKWNYCPNHSKCNPAEMLNRTAKERFRGSVLTSGSGDRDAMEQAKQRAGAALKDATHGGETIRVLPHHRAGVAAGRNGEQERARWEISYEYDELKSFSKKRGTFGPWQTTVVSEDIKEAWRALNDPDHEEDEDEDPNVLAYAALEERVEWAKKHMRHYNLYGVIFTKCAPEDPEKCAWCEEHPWRGSNWFEERTTAANTVCPQQGGCGLRVCDHALNKTYLGLLDEMKRITPESGRTPRKCSICRAEGHNKKTCPRRGQEDGAEQRGGGGARRR
jgi:hypothetical protein